MPWIDVKLYDHRVTDESVPKINRSGPTTSSAVLKTCSNVSPGVYLIHEFELDVSRCTLGQESASINASRSIPAPKCGMMIGTDGYFIARPCRSSGLP